jgi:hypothetical protein
MDRALKGYRGLLFGLLDVFSFSPDSTHKMFVDYKFLNKVLVAQYLDEVFDAKQ